MTSDLPVFYEAFGETAVVTISDVSTAVLTIEFDDEIYAGNGNIYRFIATDVAGIKEGDSVEINGLLHKVNSLNAVGGEMLVGVVL